MWPLESHFYIQSVNIKTTSVHLSATTLKPPMQHCAGAPHANKAALTLEGLDVMSGTGTLTVDPLGSRVGHLQIWLVPLHPTYLIGLRSGSTLWALCGTPLSRFGSVAWCTVLQREAGAVGECCYDVGSGSATAFRWVIHVKVTCTRMPRPKVFRQNNALE